MYDGLFTSSSWKNMKKRSICNNILMSNFSRLICINYSYFNILFNWMVCIEWTFLIISTYEDNKKSFWYVLHILLHERFQREGFDTSQQKNEKRNPPKISIIYILPIYKPHTFQLLVKNCKIVENNAKKFTV